MSGVSMLADKSVMARLAIASIGWAMLSVDLCREKLEEALRGFSRRRK